jgi:hypothetical protein
MEVTDLQLLHPKHDEMPVYVPLLKSTVGMGHFVLVSNGSSEPLIGQLLSMCHERPNHPYYNIVNVCCYLPLFSNATQQHINNPTILPRKLCGATTKDVIELVNIGKIAQVNVASIFSIAFVFLESDVTNNLFFIDGVKNAFVIRFKYCQSRKLLVSLDSTSFFCFPDLDPVN